MYLNRVFYFYKKKEISLKLTLYVFKSNTSHP